jgi:hypothetical protein
MKEVLRLLEPHSDWLWVHCCARYPVFGVDTGVYTAVRDGTFLSAGVAGLAAVCGWRGMVDARQQLRALRRGRFQAKMERRQRSITRTLFAPRACGACGSRVVVCRAPQTLGFSRAVMNETRPIGAEPSFYCPGCGKFYPVAEGYDLPAPSGSAAGDGKQYRWSAAARGLYQAGMLGCLMVLIWLVEFLSGTYDAARAESMLRWPSFGFR